MPKSNRNFILIAALVAAVALVFGISNYDAAQPEIGIDFKITRTQALQNAREFLASRKMQTTGMEEAVTFAGDDSARIYIERVLGVERLVSVSKDSVDVWFWNARFFKPLQKLEYRVFVDPSGRVVGFQRVVEETSEGARLDSAAAQAMAEAFLSGPMAVNLDMWKLVEIDSEDKPNRRDYTLTYEMNDFKVGEATYRLKVSLQGAEAASFQRYLRVPEDWWREWMKQRSRNMAFQFSDEFIYIFIVIAGFYFLFRHIKFGQIAWKPTVWLAASLAVATFVMVLNSIPLAWAGIDTTKTYGAFLGSLFFGALVNALLAGAEVLLSFGAGERLYREDYPNKLFVPALFTKRGMKSKEFFEATVMGYILAAIGFGWVILYYLIGRRFGFWSPAEVKYDDTVSTWLPWIYPLAISLGAAMKEEFWFRLFGISLFRRLTKSNALAVILPAFIWGFLHSAYMQQPGYARGIEVGVVGLMAGYVMLRFGIWSGLVYHYLFDSVMIGLFLFRSSNPYYWTSGLIVCFFSLVPAAVAGVLYLRNRRFEPVDDLLNSAVDFRSPPPADLKERMEPPPDHPPAISPVEPTTTSFDARKAVIAGVVGITLAFIPTGQKFGDDYQFNISRTEAISRAEMAVKAAYQVDLTGYHSAAHIGAQDLLDADQSKRQWVITYLKKYTDQPTAEAILLSAQGESRYSWQVEFKKPEEPVEYRASIRLDDGNLNVWVILPDSAVGVELTAERAKIVADSLFKAIEPNATAFTMIEEKSFKRPHRRDYRYVFETILPIAGEAKLRRAVNLKGDRPEITARWVKVPESWERSEEESRAGKVILKIVMWLVILGLGVWSLVFFGRSYKQGDVDWRNAKIAAIIVGSLSFLEALNGIPLFWDFYITSFPLGTMTLIFVIVQLIGILLKAGFTLVIVAAAESMAATSFGGSNGIFSRAPTRSDGESDLAAVIGLLGVLGGVAFLLKKAENLFSLPVHGWNLNSFGLEGAYCLAFSELSSAFFLAVVLASGLTILFALLTKREGEEARIHGMPLRFALMIALFLGLALWGVNRPGNLTGGEMLWAGLKVIVPAVAAYGALRAWLGGRLVALIGAILIGRLVMTGIDFLGRQGGLWATDGMVLLVAAALVFGWLAWRIRPAKP